MNKAILGKKLGMTQVFSPKGLVIPVTVVEANPNVVVQIKNEDNDGYNALVVAYGEIKEKLVNKPMAGTFKKAGVKPLRSLKEFRFDDIANYTVGQEIKCVIKTIHTVVIKFTVINLWVVVQELEKYSKVSVWQVDMVAHKLQFKTLRS